MVLQKVLKWPCDYAMVGYQGVVLTRSKTGAVTKKAQ